MHIIFEFILNKKESRMRTPISYYGGKQMQVKYIIPLIYAPYDCYVEPFFGGGAVFFAKKPDKNEIINDKKDNVINFYKVLKTDFDALYKLVDVSLYSESEYRRAKIIHDNPCDYDNVTRAWAFWYLSRSSFGSIITRGFSFTLKNDNKRARALDNRKKEFYLLKHRMEYVTIMSSDALDVIAGCDSDKTFFYLDPPYVGANQNYYAGYTQGDFDALLDLLKNIKGHFLLSSYQNDALDRCIKDNGWHEYTYSVICATGDSRAEHKKRRVEHLTANYEMHNDLFLQAG